MMLKHIDLKVITFNVQSHYHIDFRSKFTCRGNVQYENSGVLIGQQSRQWYSHDLQLLTFVCKQLETPRV